jgi:hypothetical protein
MLNGTEDEKEGMQQQQKTTRTVITIDSHSTAWTQFANQL